MELQSSSNVSPSTIKFYVRSTFSHKFLKCRFNNRKKEKVWKHFERFWVSSLKDPRIRKWGGMEIEKETTEFNTYFFYFMCYTPVAAWWRCHLSSGDLNPKEGLVTNKSILTQRCWHGGLKTLPTCRFSCLQCTWALLFPYRLSWIHLWTRISTLGDCRRVLSD